MWSAGGAVSPGRVSWSNWSSGAGDEVGCAVIEDLVLAAPLVVHRDAGVQAGGGGTCQKSEAGRCRCTLK